MKAYYVADDGGVFSSATECEEHEQELAKEKEEKKKFSEERETRAKEVMDAYQKYEDLFKAYKKDYGVETTNWQEWFNKIFAL